MTVSNGQEKYTVKRKSPGIDTRELVIGINNTGLVYVTNNYEEFKDCSRQGVVDDFNISSCFYLCDTCSEQIKEDSKLALELIKTHRGQTSFKKIGRSLKLLSDNSKDSFEIYLKTPEKTGIF